MSLCQPYADEAVWRIRIAVHQMVGTHPPDRSARLKDQMATATQRCHVSVATPEVVVMINGTILAVSVLSQSLTLNRRQ